MTYADISAEMKDFAAAVNVMTQAHADVVTKGAKLQADLAAFLGTPSLDPATAAALAQQTEQMQKQTEAAAAAMAANQPK